MFKLNTGIIPVVIGILPITFREHACDTTLITLQGDTLQKEEKERMVEIKERI